ncbi:hypothetical protein [Streptomyces sp. NPDC059873]|uniref:hypothetical protein n=1 Tax=Streptomyces sp. NPDC059873 TaxID=3346982 RepID=UPI0036659C37
MPGLSDIAVVDVLDSTPGHRRPAALDSGPVVVRPLAVKAACPTEVAPAVGTADELVRYDADRLVTQCLRTGHPVMVAHVDEGDLARIARDAGAAAAWPGAASSHISRFR